MSQKAMGLTSRLTNERTFSLCKCLAGLRMISDGYDLNPEFLYAKSYFSLKWLSDL